MHIAAKSQYSVLRSQIATSNLPALAKAKGHSFVGLCDFGSTAGHAKFEQSCAKYNIKPLFGVELAMVSELDEQRHSLVKFIAKSDAGLKAIYHYTGIALAQKCYRPKLTMRQVKEFLDHEVFGIISYSINEHNHFARNEKRALVGLAPRHDMQHALSKAYPDRAVLDIGPVYGGVEDKDAIDLILKTSPHTKIGEIDREPLPFMSEGVMRAAFGQFGLENRKIAERALAHALELGEICTAKIHRQNLINLKGDLDGLCISGMEWRGLNGKAEYEARLAREMAVIREKGMEGYFLLVADLMGHCRSSMEFLVGPGRGSSAGSLVCYVLGITEVDPIRYGLLFERFIDPGRADFPDIDIDVPDTQRDSLFAYLSEAYGQEYVGKLSTSGALGAKSALADIGRIYRINQDVMRRVSEITNDQTSLDEILRSEEMSAHTKNFPQLFKAKLLEGVVRFNGVHPSGVVVSEEPLAMSCSVDGERVAQIDLHDAEYLNLLKLDLLGLRTLSVLTECFSIAGESPLFLFALGDAVVGEPFNDPKVFDVFNRGRTHGIFQFDGRAVGGLLRKLGKVESLEDLAALSALARPGPLVGGAADGWIAWRSGKAEARFDHPALEKSLAQTGGLIVYQEQLMSLVRDLAGFSESDVNGVRKATGKKIPEKLAAYLEQFIDGCRKLHNIDEYTARAIWHKIAEFGSYSFNKSHAIAYAMVSYWCAYCKAYMPEAYALALLKHSKGEDDERQTLTEYQLAGGKFVFLDLERSEASWSIGKDRALIAGFEQVKGIGSKTAQSIIEKREKHGAMFVESLSPAMRKKLFTFENYKHLDCWEFQRTYSEVYDRGKSRAPHAVRICDLESQAIETGGEVCFAGRLVRAQIKDMNEQARIDKRGGKVMKGQTKFVNCFFNDGSGEIGMTLGRDFYEDFGRELIEGAGKAFVVRADLSKDGGWGFVKKVKCLDKDE